jgi:hypothetical protein
MNEKVENLGLDGYERTFPAQFPAFRVEYAVLEMIAQDKIPLVSRQRCNTSQRKNGGNPKLKLIQPERQRPPPLA